jgi:hypothetical protein
VRQRRADSAPGPTRFWLSHLNLLAVEGKANAQKGDGDAATWLPGNNGFRCEYVARRVAVEATYGLWGSLRHSMTLSLECWAAAPTNSFLRRRLRHKHRSPSPSQFRPRRSPRRPRTRAARPGSGSSSTRAGPCARCLSERDLRKLRRRAGGRRGTDTDRRPGYSRKLDRDGDGVGCE